MILLTGANGFLGKEFRSLNPDLEILPAYRTTTQPRWSTHGVELDLAETAQFEILSSRKPKITTVIHLASHIEIALLPNPAGNELPPVPGEEDFPKIYRDGLLATINVAKFCLWSGARLIFASSQTVYGLPPQESVDESTPCQPLEHYAQAKLNAEQALLQFSRQGLSVTTLRFPGLYGENRRDGVVFRMCEAAKQRGEIHVSAKYPLPIDVLHVADAASALRLAHEKPAAGWRCFNISTGEACSLDLLADTVAAVASKPVNVHHAEIPQPTLRMRADKAWHDLGWRALPRAERIKQVYERA